MNCKKCGLPIMDGTKVCSVCGTPVEETSETVASENPTIENLPKFDNEPVNEVVNDVTDVTPEAKEEAPSVEPAPAASNNSAEIAPAFEEAPKDEPAPSVSEPIVAPEMAQAEAQVPSQTEPEPVIDPTMFEAPSQTIENTQVSEPSAPALDAPVAPVSSESAPATPLAEAPKKKSNKFLIIVIVLVVLIALVAVLILTGGIKVKGNISYGGTSKQFGNDTTTTTESTTTTTQSVVATAQTVTHYGYKFTLPSGFEVSTEAYMENMNTIVNKQTKSIICYELYSTPYQSLTSDDYINKIKTTYSAKEIKTDVTSENVNGVEFKLLTLSNSQGKTLEYLVNFKNIGSMIIYVYATMPDASVYNNLIGNFVGSAAQESANFANPTLPSTPTIYAKVETKTE